MSRPQRTLIVFAHPEPQSFGNALLAHGRRALEAAGGEVVVSDLYAMGFDPVATAADFTERRFPDRLQYDREQKHAAEHACFAPDIRTELDKLFWCDQLVLQFPLWWFSVPAIMKGWIDRVFVNGLVYGKGRRLDTGGLKGRRAMLAITTGCYPQMVEPDGMLGAIEVNLWHLHNGTFRYSGLDVVPPFLAWSIHYTTEEGRAAYLEQYARRLVEMDGAEPLFFHPQADFENYRLKAGIPSRSVGLRQIS